MKEIEFIGKCLLINESGKKILVIGDLHLGYEETLNESGVYIGRRMFDEMIEYFDRVFARIGEMSISDVLGVGGDEGKGEKLIMKTKKNCIVDEAVLLGDVKHVIGGIIKQEWKDVLGVIDYLMKKCGKILVVKGQHDAILEPILGKRNGIEILDYYISGKYGFVHGDKEVKEIEGNEVKVWVMGNGHPAVKITDGTKVEKYKCFLVGKYKGKEVIICPSFASANLGTDAREYDLGMAWNFDYDKFKVIVVGEELKDLDFGRLDRLE